MREFCPMATLLLLPINELRRRLRPLSLRQTALSQPPRTDRRVKVVWRLCFHSRRGVMKFRPKMKGEEFPNFQKLLALQNDKCQPLPEDLGQSKSKCIGVFSRKPISLLGIAVLRTNH